MKKVILLSFAVACVHASVSPINPRELVLGNSQWNVLTNKFNENFNSSTEYRTLMARLRLQLTKLLLSDNYEESERRTYLQIAHKIFQNVHPLSMRALDNVLRIAEDMNPTNPSEPVLTFLNTSKLPRLNFQNQITAYTPRVDQLLAGELAKQGSWLYTASEEGNEKAVHQLIALGVDVNAKKHGATPLYVASSNGHDKVVQLLLDKGANINQVNKYGKTPLFIASEEGHLGVVRQLLGEDANVNQAEIAGFTPLFVASQDGHDKLVELLLANDANVNLAQIDKITPLHIASKRGHEKVVQLLLDAGADVNQADEDGDTPVYAAYLNDKEKVVELLKAAGANLESLE